MSSGAISTAELDYATNNKPMLVGSNALESASVEKWLIVDTLSGSADKTLTNHPISRARDRFNHLQTKPDTTSASTWYLSFDLTADVADFDCLFIGGHNFGTVGGLTVSLEIGTDATFGSVTELYTTTPGSSDKRIFTADLANTGISSLPLRHSGERYVRLKMTKGSDFTPAIGELWLGRRRQLPYKFNIAAQEKRTRSEVVRFESRSGVSTTYTLSQGKAMRSGSIEMDDATCIADVTEWWKECGYGTKPFLWIENPTASPSDVHVMTCAPELFFDLTGPSSRSLDLSMSEVAPYLTSES